jgi:DNA-binding MarR family transcriptional regulator
MWWMIAFSALGGLVVLFFFGRRNERAVRRDWELLLTPKGEKLYRSIESRVSSEMALANITYDEAFTVRALGSMDEAKHLLDVGYKVIENFSPNMLRLLGAMGTFSRMVSAMAPVQPLNPQGFRVAQIASLAYLNQLFHNFLVTTAERYRLRVYILGRSFGLATRFLLSSTKRIAGGEPNAEREWEQIELIREDFQTLTEESLESLRVLLTSLAAEGRDDLIQRM